MDSRDNFSPCKMIASEYPFKDSWGSQSSFFLRVVSICSLSAAKAEGATFPSRPLNSAEQQIVAVPLAADTSFADNAVLTVSILRGSLSCTETFTMNLGPQQGTIRLTCPVALLEEPICQERGAKRRMI